MKSFEERLKEADETDNQIHRDEFNNGDYTAAERGGRPFRCYLFYNEFIKGNNPIICKNCKNDCDSCLYDLRNTFN